MNLQENISIITQKIKNQALKLGFVSCGISKAGFLEQEAPRLESWLKSNKNGTMSYMNKNFDKRLDPTKLVLDAKSVISLSYNYYTKKSQPMSAPKVSKYAYGEDYHYVLKDKLNELLNFIKENVGEVNGRAFVDSAPVLEKAWAAKSGIGWLGKNSNIITKSQGSYYFLCEIVLDLELKEDFPTTNHCGTCTACIDACPTDAINEPYSIDSNKCISYFTIELKDEIPKKFEGFFEDWIFGCDICQDVCPWNSFATENSEPRFTPSETFLQMSKEDWIDITEETFDFVFKKTPLKRAKYKGIKKNLKFLYPEKTKL